MSGITKLFDRLVALAKARPIAFGGFALAVFAFSLAQDFGLWSHLDRAAMTPDRFERVAMKRMKAGNEGEYRILLLYKEHMPDLFRSIMEKGANASRNGKGKDDLANIMRAEIANYTASKTKELSDVGILQMSDLITKQLEQLAKEGRDDICMKMMRQEGLGAVQWSDEMTELEYQLAQALVLDKGGSGKVADQERVQEAVDAAIAELMKKHGQQKVAATFGAISEPGATPEGSCTVFADYFILLRKAPATHEAEVMRAIFTAES